MSGRRFSLGWVHLRRGVQLAFLGLFVGLILWPHFAPSSEAPAALQAFFHLDPFIALSTWLTTHTVVRGIGLALGLVVLTVLFGRVFCGWICPMGTVHDAAGRALFAIWPDRQRRDHWSRWQLTKYVILVAFLVMAVCGSRWGTLWDPLVLLYRSMTAAVLPGAQWAVEDASKALYDSDNAVAQSVSSKVAEPVYKATRDYLFGGVDRQRQAYWGGGAIFVLFLGLLAINRYRPRFWCRYLCPLGGLLGVLSLRPLLRRKTTAACNQCDLCGMRCHGGAAGGPGEQWKPAECFGCLNCTTACHRESLHFQLASPLAAEPKLEPLGLSRRAVLGGAVGGAAGLMAMRITPQARGKSLNADLLRPPGARKEAEFLDRCLGCGLCMQVCPTGGLQPTLLEAGLEGLWTPRLVPQIGPCSYTCTLCLQVCPTEAIQRMDLEAKQKTKIGLAAFDVSRCLPYAFGRDCMVCEESCPVPDKAIFYLDVEVRNRAGEKLAIKQPHVDPDLCIGCGQCEKMCVFVDRPAIRVFATNESRNPNNQPILPSADPYG